MTTHPGPAVLAIDQGTSATKAVVLDAGYRILGQHEVRVPAVHGPAGAVETDPAALLESVLVAGRTAVQRAGDAGMSVQAVALANQGETVLAWDPTDGRPLSPAIGWQDRRAQEVTDELSSSDPTLARWVADRSGLVLDPYFSAPKLAWLRRRVGAGVVTTSDTWLVHRLCGEFVTDAATASRSLLLAPGGDPASPPSWDDDLLSVFGLQHERLPRIVGCDEIVGTTTAFGRPLPVAGLLVDQQAALLGHACLEPGSAKCTFGTGAFLLAQCGESAVRSRAGLSTSIAWRLRGRTAYCLDGQVFAAGSAVRWLRTLGLIQDAADLDRLCAGIDSGAGIDGGAGIDSGEEPGGGVLCVPALAGLGAPWWRPDARAVFTGLSLAAGPGHLALAVLQGIAAQVAELIDAAGADLAGTDLARADLARADLAGADGTCGGSDIASPGSTTGPAPGRIDTLQVDGGLVACRTLMQSVADIAQRRVELAGSAQATAEGVAAAAFLALDVEATARDVVPSRAPTEVYAPRWSAAQAAEFRARWLSVLHSTPTHPAEPASDVPNGRYA